MFSIHVVSTIILPMLLNHLSAQGYDQQRYEYKRRNEDRRRQHQYRQGERQRRRQQKEEDAMKKAVCTIDADHQYGWEGTNFYELLALPFNENESTSVAEVKKAYRKQAQEWHPDKKKPDQELSAEEINARFHRITLAQEVLSDPDKKQEYDEWMMYCYADQEPEASHLDYEQLINVDLIDRQTFIDPTSGLLIVRIIQREEYESHYRIIAQDFSPGPTGYTPIFDEPMIVEEGKFNDHQDGETSTITDVMWSSQQLSDTTSNTQQQQPQQDENVLTHLESQNGRYKAGVVNCQLFIIDKFDKNTDDGVRSDEPKTIWTSDNHSPPWATNCVLKLHGPHLVLQYDDTNLLWWSESDSQYMGEFIVNNKNNSYFARLDNDGTLTVYYRSDEDDDDRDLYQFQQQNKHKFSAFDEKFESLFNEDNEEKDWPFIGKWLRTTDKCVFSTGPSGCHRLKRKIRHVIKDVKQMFRIVEETWTKADTYAGRDNFNNDDGKSNRGFYPDRNHDVDYDNYEDEYIDLVEEVTQFVSRAGYHISKIGRKILLQGTQTLRKKFAQNK